MTRETYGQVYEEGRDRTIHFLLSRGVTAELAPDIAQTAWLRGWERLSQLRDERMVFTWVNTIALNQYRRLIRRERLRQQFDQPVDTTTSLNLAAIDVARILTFCRPRDRVLLEAQMGGVTPKEMARERGVSETAIRIRFLRARRYARVVLEKTARRMSPRLVETKQIAASAAHEKRQGVAA